MKHREKAGTANGARKNTRAPRDTYASITFVAQSSADNMRCGNADVAGEHHIARQCEISATDVHGGWSGGVATGSSALQRVGFSI